MPRKIEMPEDVRRMTAEMRKAYDNPDLHKHQIGRRNPKAVSAAETMAQLRAIREDESSPEQVALRGYAKALHDGKVIEGGLGAVATIAPMVAGMLAGGIKIPMAGGQKHKLGSRIGYRQTDFPAVENMARQNEVVMASAHFDRTRDLNAMRHRPSGIMGGNAWEGFGDGYPIVGVLSRDYLVGSVKNKNSVMPTDWMTPIAKGFMQRDGRADVQPIERLAEVWKQKGYLMDTPTEGAVLHLGEKNAAEWKNFLGQSGEIKTMYHKGVGDVYPIFFTPDPATLPEYAASFYRENGGIPRAEKISQLREALRSVGSDLRTIPYDSVEAELLRSAPRIRVQEAAKGGDTRADANGGNASAVPKGHNPALDGYSGPRVVINPSTFRNEKDSLCVAFNEAFRILMQVNGFDPVAEPTEKQREFFSDTAYADDELQMRRTILARLCTFDTSVTDPTDEQLQEAVEFLDTVLEIGAPQNRFEQQAVERIRTAISQALESGERVPASQAPAPEGSPEVAAGGAGSSAGGVPEDEEKDSGAEFRENARAQMDEAAKLAQEGPTAEEQKTQAMAEAAGKAAEDDPFGKSEEQASTAAWMQRTGRSGDGVADALAQRDERANNLRQVDNGRRDALGRMLGDRGRVIA